jgi:hypothetical protein
MVLVPLEGEPFKVVLIRIDGVLSFGDRSLGDPTTPLRKEVHVGLDV